LRDRSSIYVWNKRKKKFSFRSRLVDQIDSDFPENRVKRHQMGYERNVSAKKRFMYFVRAHESSRGWFHTDSFMFLFPPVCAINFIILIIILFSAIKSKGSKFVLGQIILSLTKFIKKSIINIYHIREVYCNNTFHNVSN
jgi:hypothetical protein